MWSGVSRLLRSGSQGADGRISLDEGHRIGGAVKAAIRAAAPSVADVHVHMEPYVEPSSAATIPDAR